MLLAVAALAGCAPAVTPEPAPDPVTAEPIEPPAPPPTVEELRRAAAERWVDSATTRQLAGSVIMVSHVGVDPEDAHRFMADSGFGGFILMGGNIPATPEQLREFTAALTVDGNLPPLVAIDEEGGVVTRLPWDAYAGADTLRWAPEDEVEAAFAGRAQLLAEVGANVNFGIVADATGDPGSFIYPRTLGDDPASAAPRVAAAVAGERAGAGERVASADRTAVASTLKHFPGHGAVVGDTHFGILQTGMAFDEWRGSEALPFRAGIDAGAELLMFGHLAYTAVSPAPASLAPEWYAIARDELGFSGVAVTDDLGMLEASGLPEYADPAENVVAALRAGADLALVVYGTDEAILAGILDRATAAVDSGELPLDRVREAATRVVELRLELTGLTGLARLAGLAGG